MNTDIPPAEQRSGDRSAEGQSYEAVYSTGMLLVDILFNLFTGSLEAFKFRASGIVPVQLAEYNMPLSLQASGNLAITAFGSGGSLPLLQQIRQPPVDIDARLLAGGGILPSGFEH